MPAAPAVLIALLALLTTYRLTRLVTGDYLTDTPRRWLQRHLPEKLAYLVGCPWCASFWIGIPVALVAVDMIDPPSHRWAWAAMLALAGSAVAGQLSNLEAVEDLGTVDDGEPEEPADDADPATPD